MELCISDDFEFNEIKINEEVDLKISVQMVTHSLPNKTPVLSECFKVVWLLFVNTLLEYSFIGINFNLNFRLGLKNCNKSCYNICTVSLFKKEVKNEIMETN